MKKIFFFLLVFICDVVYASNVYISKKDYNTGEFLSDCDFILYDSGGNVVDMWIPNNSFHVSSLDNGSYRLVSRPYVMDKYDNGLSVFYDLNITDNDMFLTIYNEIISTPPNLGSSGSVFYLSVFLIIIGFLILILGKYYIF